MSEHVRGRFRDFVEVHMEAVRILSEETERSLIGDGISKFKLDGPQARGVIAVVASQSGQLLESDVSRHMLNVLHQLTGKKGAVSKRQFDKAVVILIAMVKGHLSEPAAKAWMKRLIENADMRVRRGGWTFTRRWFRRIKAPK